MLNFRQKRLFFVSSSSTTSTLSTTTLCFVSSTSAVTTCGKRKRALGVHELGDLADIQIASSAVLRYVGTVIRYQACHCPVLKM